MNPANGNTSSLPGSLHGSQPASLPKSADIVILGAGVMGASIAFHLAKRQAERLSSSTKITLAAVAVDARRHWCACTTAFPRKCSWR